MSENQLTAQTIEISEKAESERQLERIPSKINLLSALDDYLTSLIEEDDEKTKYHERSLVTELKTKTNGWQFLSLGTDGEVFSYLVGAKILKDFPEVVRKEDATESGRIFVSVEKRPINSEDNAVIRVRFKTKDVNDDQEYYFEYVFDTTPSNVTHHLDSLIKKRKQLRTQALLLDGVGG